MSTREIAPQFTAPPAFERADPDAIERWVDELPREEVVGVLHLVAELRRALYQGERFLQSRIVADQILSSGETWESPDGRRWMWGGDRERVCSDPEALRFELGKLALSPMAKLALGRAFKARPLQVYLREIDQIEKFGNEEARRAIREYIDWRESAPRLRPLDEEGR